MKQTKRLPRSQLKMKNVWCGSQHLESSEDAKSCTIGRLSRIFASGMLLNHRHPVRIPAVRATSGSASGTQSSPCYQINQVLDNTLFLTAAFPCTSREGQRKFCFVLLIHRCRRRARTDHATSHLRGLRYCAVKICIL